MGRLFVLTGGDPQITYMSERWGRPLAAATTYDSPSLLFDAPRPEVEKALEGKRIVAFFGHGTEDSLGRPEVIDTRNIYLATGIVVAVACRSSQRLGQAAVAKHAEAYVGFDDDISVYQSTVIDKLIHDGFAKLVAGTETPAEFKLRFIAACQKVQDKYIHSRDEFAHSIGTNAQVLKKSLQVLEA